MSQDCVVAVYDSFEKAKAGVQALEKADFPPEQVSFVTHSVDDEVPREAVQYGDKAELNTAKGAGVGGLVGALLATPLIAVGGVGSLLVAGPLAMGLTGAIVGGFLGAMSGWGVDDDHRRRYEEMVAEGSMLVVANGDPRQAAEARRILRQTDAAELHLHAQTSADTVEP